MENNDKKLKVMIIEDEEDILNLYKDYLSRRGHDVVASSNNASNVVTDCEKCQPDICLVDHILGGSGTGIDAATQIIENNPSMPILFTSAYESLNSELLNHHEFDNKNIQVLLKPSRLSEIENAMLRMVN
jgi:two-component SAPR family response regulator